MTPQIVTQHLILAPLLRDDAQSFFEYRSHPDVARYQSWAPSSLEQAVSFIEGFQSVDFDCPGTWFQLAIRHRESGGVIGDLGVHFPAELRDQVELGITVTPARQGQGYGTEAVTGLLSHLFEALRKHRVFASVDPRNQPAVALLKRLGMRQEAHFRKSLWFKGEWADDLVFAILREEWNQRDRNTGSYEAP